MSAGRDRDRVGVLVMAHGTPAKPDELAAFYTRIRRGRPPSDEQLADLRRRYDAIGGTSPLTARTAAQVAGIAAALESAEPGRYEVRYGAKHAAPLIEDGARELARAGVTRVVGVVLTPHRSSPGSGEYLSRARGALADAAPGVAFRAVEQWYDAPGFADLLAERVHDALEMLREEMQTGGRTTVLFSAHAIPRRVIDEGDPYAEQVASSAALVAGAAGLSTADIAWQVAWQSAGRTPEPWLEPDVLQVIRTLGAARTGTAAGVVVCPVGFVSDHLEVLYDLDIEARQVAREAGVVFARTASLNDDPRFSAMLATVVRDAVKDGAEPDASSPSRGGRAAPRRAEA